MRTDEGPDAYPPPKRAESEPSGASKRAKTAVIAPPTAVIGMAALPRTVLIGVLGFAAHEELHAVEQVCRALYTTVRTESLWEKLVRRTVAFMEEEAPVDALGWKDLACLVSRPEDRFVGLLDAVIACSSVDRPIESPTNTLQPSPCWLAFRAALDQRILSNESQDEVTLAKLGKNAQIECGCESGEACYWSTTASTDKDIQDYIEYTVHQMSSVSRLQIVPYKAHWHPQTPTYGPCAISASFYVRTTPADGSEPHEVLLYQSPIYPVINDMELQEFVLPKHVWLPSGAILRLNLLGRHQAETFELPDFVPTDEHVPNYYTSVSYVAAVGINATPSYSDTAAP